jgi:hypothetical protein
VKPRTDGVVVTLGVTAVTAWLLSYSWLLGVVLPMPALDLAVSPWLVAEILAVIAGAGAAAVPLAAGARPAAAPMSRRARTWAVLGGVAGGLALLSLMWWVAA